MESSFDWAAAVRDAPIGMAFVASSGQWLEVNPALCELVGYSREELLALTCQSITHPNDREIDLSYRRAMLGGELDRYDMEMRYLHKDGRTLWIGLHVTPARNVDGRLTCFIVQIVDTTERKQIEQRLYQAQKLEAVGQLTAGIAHDFNNMLAAIRLQVDDAVKDLDISDDARLTILDIGVTASLAANLTQQLLRFSHGQRLQTQLVDINDSVSGVAKLLRRLLPDTIRIDLWLSSTRACVSTDPGLIDQIVMNLMINARDAMAEGGTLTLTTALVELGAQRARTLHVEPGRYVALRCSDTGCGIAAAHLPRIFEPLFTTKAPDRGTGLGLATVLGIVKQHRGAIDVTSSVGHGSTFEVFLPASEGSADPPTPRGGTGAPPVGGDETILLVEHDPGLRCVLRKLLDRHGYQVLEASCAAEALGMWECSARKPHLLLTDLSVSSGVGGRELACELQARAPDLRVLLTSGYSADFASVAKLSCGQYFLAKPCSSSLLLETVRWCLDGRF